MSPGAVRRQATRVAREQPARPETPRVHRATSGTPHGGVRSWLLAHADALQDSATRLLRAPLSSTLTWMVLAIAMALPGGFQVCLENLRALGGYWEGSSRISLFLGMEVSERDGLGLAEQLESRAGVAGVHFVTRKQALEEFQTVSGMSGLLKELGENPLPALIIVRPAEGNSLAQVRALRDELAGLPAVEVAQLDLEWLARLQEMIELARRFGEGLAAILGLAVLLLVGNATRLVIEDRRREIEVQQMVGATRAYISRPLLYTGALLGLGGGILAWLILVGFLAWVAPPINQLASLYDSEYILIGPGLPLVGALLGGGAALGWAGAWLSVSRHLAARNSA